jgi:hypothetical protein
MGLLSKAMGVGSLPLAELEPARPAPAERRAAPQARRSRYLLDAAGLPYRRGPGGSRVYDVAPNEQRIVIPRCGKLTGDVVTGSADNLPEYLATAPPDGSQILRGRSGAIKRSVDWLRRMFGQ